MDITNEIEETVDLVAEYNGQKVNFKVAKANFTPSIIKNIDKLSDYPKAIAGCVKDWDVTAHGEKWGLDEDSLSRLPAQFLATIVERISATWTGDAKKKNPSQSSSAAAAS